MTQEELTYVLSDKGRLLLEAAWNTSGDSLKRQSVLRRDYTAEQVRAALTLLDLRERAKMKFKHADRMYFDREGLEQASGDVIADYRAKRYAGFGRVADLCCGVGGDAVALASVVSVTAVDIRPTRTLMVRANLEALGRTADCITADVRQWCPNANAFFLDPSRRESGKKVTTLSAYAPSVDKMSWLPRNPTLGIKVAPGIRHDEIPEGCETEFISVEGECREAVLWFGDLRGQPKIRATLLPGGNSLVGEDVDPVPVRSVSAYVLEPDRAVIRAHLVDQIATMVGAHKLAPDVAYLTSETAPNSPFVRAFKVRDVLPFSIKRVQAYTETHGIGTLDIKKRRFPMTPEAVYRKLRLKGSERATMILTRVDDELAAIFADPVLGS